LLTLALKGAKLLEVKQPNFLIVIGCYLIILPKSNFGSKIYEVVALLCDLLSKLLVNSVLDVLSKAGVSKVFSIEVSSSMMLT